MCQASGSIYSKHHCPTPDAWQIVLKSLVHKVWAICALSKVKDGCCKQDCSILINLNPYIGPETKFAFHICWINADQRDEKGKWCLSNIASYKIHIN